ncbi:MAG: hypothetical protein AAB871_03910 [Patescibacteria group bacterium]
MKEPEIHISWWQKTLLKFWPKLAFRKFAKIINANPELFEKAQQVFGKVKTIDLIPLDSSNGRGFMLVLDRKTSLWFLQDGDHFVYDGFEMGEYEKGDVAIFDQIKS